MDDYRRDTYSRIWKVEDVDLITNARKITNRYDLLRERVQICWFIQSESTGYLVHRGKRIKELDTFYDCYPQSEVNSFQYLAGDMDLWKTIYALGGNTPLYLIAESTIKIVPGISVKWGKHDYYNSIDKYYYTDAYQGSIKIDDGLEYDELWQRPSVQEEVLYKGTVLHSHMTKGQINKAIEKYKRDWNKPDLGIELFGRPDPEKGSK